MTKLALIHFQPLERYPPAMNMIRSLAARPGCRCSVYTTADPRFGRFGEAGVPIHRTALRSGRIGLYLTYLLFNVSVLLRLLVQRPGHILYYETYSCWPVALYRMLGGRFRLWVHHHEYGSPEETASGSAYYRYLSRLERQMQCHAALITQTNGDRVRLFLHDHPELKPDAVRALPNYPPASWQQHRAEAYGGGTFRLIYSGALGADTTYFFEFAEWLEQASADLRWDIYSNNLDPQVAAYLEQYKGTRIRFLGSVPYETLPEVFSRYHAGLVFYKGIIPNHAYCVPNKVWEYAACGLQVWYTEALVTLRNLASRLPDSEAPHPPLPGFLKVLGTLDKREITSEHANTPFIDDFLSNT